MHPATKQSTQSLPCNMMIFKPFHLHSCVIFQGSIKESEVSKNQHVLEFIMNTDQHVCPLTSPAPWNTKVWSDSLFLVIFRAAKTPATATEAVPGRGRERVREGDKHQGWVVKLWSEWFCTYIFQQNKKLYNVSSGGHQWATQPTNPNNCKVCKKKRRSCIYYFGLKNTIGHSWTSETK